MKKSRLLQTFLFVFLFPLLMLSGCGGGGGDESSSYTVGKGNYVLLGPIEGADIRVYRLPDTENPVATAKTGKFGKFVVTVPEETGADEILLVKASGGYDVDFDDDGVVDGAPTPFRGSLHLLCRAEDLKSGRAHITLLSDLVYQYVKHTIPQLNSQVSPDDFWRFVELVSKELINPPAGNRVEESIYKSVISFNPLRDKKLLTFNYDSLYSEGENSFMNVYHREDEGAGKEAVLASFFRNRGLSLNDSRLLNLRQKIKINLRFPERLVNLSVSSEGGGVGSLSDFKNQGYFVDKKTPLTIKINSVKAGFKVLRWFGCDRVSEDRKTCFINGAVEDRMVFPFVVPERISLKSGVEVVDVSGAVLRFPEANGEDIDDLKITSAALNTVEVYVDVNDEELKNVLKTISENGVGSKKYILVNKKPPVFFRKVVSATKLQDSDYRYRVETEFTRLTDVVESGYVLLQMTDLGAVMPDGVKLVSSSYTLPDGTVVPAGPNDGLVLRFSENGDVRVAVAPVRGSVNESWNETVSYPYDYYLYGNETTSNSISINGTIVVMPYVSYGMSWSWDYYKPVLNQIFAEIGAETGTKNNLKLKFKGTYKKKIELLKKPIRYSQTFTVYGIPVEVSERIQFVCGIKGAGSGKEFDNATFEGNGTVNATLGVNARFGFVYDGDTAVYFNLDEFHELTGHLAAKAGAFGYIGAVPGVALYGFGVQMENSVGAYLKGNFEGSAAFQDIENIPYNATFHGEIGLGYYGLVSVYAEDVKLFEDNIEDTVKKLNEKIRGRKYTEFWKEWPVITYDTSWSNATTSTSESMGEHVPGILVVEGTEPVFKREEGEDFSPDNSPVYVTYRIKNVGGDNLSWKIEILNQFPGNVSVLVDGNVFNVPAWSNYLNRSVEVYGSLSRGEEKEVKVEIQPFTVRDDGKYKVISRFYEVDSAPANSLIPSLPTLLQNSSSPVAEKTITLSVRPLDWHGNLTAVIYGTARVLRLNWEGAPGDSPGNYEIHYCQVDPQTRDCLNNAELILAEVDGTTTTYETPIIGNSRFSPDRTYLFRIYRVYSIPPAVINGVYTPGATVYRYGGKSNETIIPSPSTVSEGKLNVFIVVPSHCFGDTQLKSKIKGAIEDSFASKPSDASLKVGIVLEDYYGENEHKIIGLSGSESLLLSQVDDLSFNAGDNFITPSLPKTLTNGEFVSLGWEEGAKKELMTFTTSGNVSVPEGFNAVALKQLLVESGILLSAVAVEGGSPNSVVADLADLELDSAVLDTNRDVIPALRESMLPLPIH